MVKSIPVGDLPGELTLGSDGRSLFVCEFGTPAISVIDVEKAELIGRIDLADLPNAVAVAPDTSSVYVPTTNSALSNIAGDGGRFYVIDPSTGEVVRQWDTWQAAEAVVLTGEDAVVTLRVNLRTT